MSSERLRIHSIFWLLPYLYLVGGAVRDLLLATERDTLTKSSKFMEYMNIHLISLNQDLESHDNPETGTWDSFDDKRWQGFQAGYEFAYAISTAKEVMEKVQEEQEEDEWKSVALRFGEKLSGYLSDGYYELSPAAWFRWAVFTYGKGQQKDYKVGVDGPSMTNCVLLGNPPDGYVAWNEWYNEMGSKGILHNLKISSKDYQPTPQERGERFHKDVERCVRESVKWCEEHPEKSVEDYLTPKFI